MEEVVAARIGHRPSAGDRGRGRDPRVRLEDPRGAAVRTALRRVDGDLRIREGGGNWESEAEMTVEHLVEYVKLFQQGDSTIEARCNLLKEARQRILEERKKYDDALDRMNYKIEKYEQAVKTGKLVWD